jgi:hypothetical protein
MSLVKTESPGMMELDGSSRRTELNDGSGEDIVAREDEARWSLMVAPDKMESPRRGPRREAGAKDERSTEDGVGEYSGAHVCDVPH